MSGTLPNLPSPHLSLGKVYTRSDLVPITGVKGVHALYTGVFKKRDGRSVFLFVTQIKKNGRTQYDDRLEGDTLYWEGQEQRGTDNDIILADERGLELLVFYRRRWNEFPGDGFRYLGHFKYVEHVRPNGPGATRFVLERVAEPLLRPTDADDNDAFDPTNQKDARASSL